MRITILWLLLTLPVLADQPQIPLPALFKVHGVSSDDRLNVRTAPDTSSEILGSYDTLTEGLEVVGFSAKGNWAQVNVAGQTGWMSMAYLKQQPIALDDNGLPMGLRCFGTEPFWTLTPRPGTLVLARQLDEVIEIFQINSTSPAQYLQDFHGMMIDVTGDNGTHTIRVLPGRCSDGMSEHIYALHAISDVFGAGCCSIENMK
ncbi:SH3 domain-containing protein [Pseudaestuariivita rosea]|uniref:SH3 domain-containing protein n=1 Tax=Pseudaestuariivita rosea TaxID=2763263 RepID=UPI001ABA1CF9|nr:SH3 domain-containing protein [Pseudaestuariivita rosea]